MSKRPTRTVELHPAYWWTCDECGVDQFGRLMPAVPADKLEIEEFIEAMGLRGFGETAEELGYKFTGEFLVDPKSVGCSSCGAAFKTESGGEASDA